MSLYLCVCASNKLRLVLLVVRLSRLGDRGRQRGRRRLEHTLIDLFARVIVLGFIVRQHSVRHNNGVHRDHRRQHRVRGPLERGHRKVLVQQVPNSKVGAKRQRKHQATEHKQVEQRKGGLARMLRQLVVRACALRWRRLSNGRVIRVSRHLECSLALAHDHLFDLRGASSGWWTTERKKKHKQQLVPFTGRFFTVSPSTGASTSHWLPLSSSRNCGSYLRMHSTGFDWPISWPVPNNNSVISTRLRYLSRRGSSSATLLSAITRSQSALCLAMRDIRPNSGFFHYMRI